MHTPSVTVGALCAALLLAPTHAGAQDACRATPESEIEALIERLRVLSRSQIPPAADVDLPAAQALIDEVLAHPCASAHRESPWSVTAPSDEAMADWIRRGGTSYLASLIGRTYDGEPAIHLAPAMRVDLNATDYPEHPLAEAILCPRTDASCGSETRGWRLRAEQRLHQAAWFARARRSDHPLDPSCGERARVMPDHLVYQELRTCLEEQRDDRRTFMPHGRFRAPTDGWLFIAGRRGHYQFCDELRAYDLASGATYTIQSCSGLRFGQQGGVDAEQVDAARTPRVQRGTVSPALIREAAWMTFLAPYLEEGLPEGADSLDLPERVARRFVGPAWAPPPPGAWFSSNQTILSWAWVRGGRVALEGALTWPSSAQLGETMAAELLRVAEASEVEGCPRARPPSAPALTRRWVSPIDAGPQELDAVDRSLYDRLDRARRERCRAR